MKKIFLMALALTICAGLSAQKREGNVITVQGHHHELLTKQANERRLATPAVREAVGNVTAIDPGTVNCWVGCVNTTDPNMQPVDTAYLLVKWTDGKAAERGTNDSILIWGYVWNSKTPQGYDVTKYAIDMLRAVANFDCRFSALLQNTGGGNFTVGGIGYNFGGKEGRVPVIFNSAEATADANIQFHYTGSPNCAAPYNQFAAPGDPDPLATNAIDAANSTGVIKHPFDAAYGYPAYDYDYWQLSDPDDPDSEWQAGWYNGYWAFYTREGLSGSFDYAPNGVAVQQLSNNSVSYFVFAPADFAVPVNQDGDYANPICCETACSGCNTSTNK